MLYLPNIVIIILKKLNLYFFLKKIYKSLFEKFIFFEIKTIENYILDNFVDKKFGSIIDIGAHKGDKTTLFLKFFPKDRYYLFEPFDKYYQIIKKKFNNNNNIHIYKKGVSNQEGIENFYTSKNEIYAESFSLKKNKFLENIEKIEVINLDKIKFNEKIKLIKLDAEGKEPEILSGASKLILENKPILLIETSHVTYKKIEKILLNLNYIFLTYEYYNIKDPSIDYRKLDYLAKLGDGKVISSDRFENKLYKINNISNNAKFMTNSLGIPKNKKFPLNIKTVTLSLN